MRVYVMEKFEHKATTPDLDFSKLLGFRNLISVAKPEDNVRESSELAFTKKGEGEGCTVP
jgi:hypothetical protein